ncbi:hypothetical protein H0H87_012722, partial [Tephrocybe sp. NHM501043]
TPPSTDESAPLSPTISHVPASPDSPTLSEIDFCIIPPSSIEPPLTPVSPPLQAIPPIDLQQSDVAVDHEFEERLPKSPTMAETASCVVTGFLVGAFITLCLLSPQRRVLLTHLT